MNLNWYKSLKWYSQTKKVKNVLFVCLGNTCRSPSAEYFFRTMTHWWSGINAFSRGVKDELPELKARNVDMGEVALEAKKVIGDSKSKILKKHQALKITSSDALKADLILTMEKFLRDELRTAFPDVAYKIFTLKGFVEQNDNSLSADLDIGNPFLPPPKRGKYGTIKYYQYIQNYMKILLIIKDYVRRLIQIIYIINNDKR